MNHTFSTVVPLTTRIPQPLGDAFFAELCEWYCSQQHSEDTRSLIWKDMERLLYQQLRFILETRNALGLRTYLERLYLTPLVGGLDNPYPRPDQEADHRHFWNHELLKTAVALGVLPYLHPGQSTPMLLEHDKLVVAVESVLGARLDHPGGGNMPGYIVGDRFIPDKLLEAVRLWHGIRLLCDSEPTHILEIGAGCGFIAYAFGLCNRLLVNYSIIDLPLVTVIQRFLLTPTAHSAMMFFYGLKEPAYTTFDVVINHNSLPEFPADKARDMIQSIDRHTNRGALFFSVNHESMADGQSRVFDLMAPMTHWKQIRRSPAWTHPGYIEEAWRKT